MKIYILMSATPDPGNYGCKARTEVASTNQDRIENEHFSRTLDALRGNTGTAFWIETTDLIGG